MLATYVVEPDKTRQELTNAASWVFTMLSIKPSTSLVRKVSGLVEALLSSTQDASRTINASLIHATL
jgi:hypothetical protein